ncbi:hypothetical protein EPUS_04116 [Endocarpon pusillum Z07020]|uniref:Uncharacterized protein n=1 Tax=Endocarpon pusillum (strain Z07020 / HMAS-L-300199) TaxID=1263415 RepID=U1GMJ8_ENDPU|nr:uncharacterized protein EPUS_04116 [Endocarpon pusillum Z07020]ERF73493.1 hypothetical protein EPUS_04116 [Endocarpon pusillum Z07020]
MGRFHPKRLLLGAFVLLLIYVHIRHSHNNEFYTKTVKALDKKKKDQALKAETDAKVQQILNDKNPQVATSLSGPQPAAATVSESNPRLPPDPPSPPTQPQDENQKKVAADKPKYVKDTTASPTSLSPNPTTQPDPPHLAQVRAALDEIVHHHSIVIFSKTYCPHSRRAKSLLLDTYDIVPQPYVVELDTWTEPARKGSGEVRDGEVVEENIPTMGRALQDLLAQRTGRKTVPNILVLGMSLGGADEVVKLHEEGNLAGKLKGMVGKRLERCEKRVSRSGDGADGKGGHGAL